MAQSIKNRIFGDDIPSQIKQKLELRQQLAQSSEFGESINISDQQHNFGGEADLSSRTPFVRMWTAVSIFEDFSDNEIKEGNEAVKSWKKTKDENQFLKKIGKEKWEVHEWKNIENTLKIYEIGNNVLNTEAKGPNVQVSDSHMKGIFPNEQETDKNIFFKPPAGITGITSGTEGPLGVIKKTTVNFIVHNFSDFEKIYLPFFLRPGAQVFVDFGWDTAQLYNPLEIYSLI